MLNLILNQLYSILHHRVGIGTCSQPALPPGTPTACRRNAEVCSPGKWPWAKDGAHQPSATLASGTAPPMARRPGLACTAVSGTRRIP